MNYKTTKLNDLLADAKVRGEEAINYLKYLTKETTDEEGNVYKISFIALKRAYFQKFMPDCLPAPKVIKPTMYEMIASL